MESERRNVNTEVKYDRMYHTKHLKSSGKADSFAELKNGLNFFVGLLSQEDGSQRSFRLIKQQGGKLDCKQTMI